MRPPKEKRSFVDVPGENAYLLVCFVLRLTPRLPSTLSWPTSGNPTAPRYRRARKEAIFAVAYCASITIA